MINLAYKCMVVKATENPYCRIGFRHLPQINQPKQNKPYRIAIVHTSVFFMSVSSECIIQNSTGRNTSRPPGTIK